jgi:hypothetical protein
MLYSSFHRNVCVPQCAFLTVFEGGQAISCQGRLQLTPQRLYKLLTQKLSPITMQKGMERERCGGRERKKERKERKSKE